MHPLLESFRDDICARAGEIDPVDGYDWYSLSIGYFLGQGAHLDLANELALEARYTYSYWDKR